MLKELELKRLVGFANRCPEIRNGAMLMIGHYFRGFIQQRKYEKIQKFNTRRLMVLIESRMNRWRILSKTRKQTRLIVRIEKTLFEGCHVLAIVKQRDKQYELAVFPIITNKNFPPKGLKTTIPLDIMNTNNIFHNLYFDPLRGILTTLHAFLDHHHNLFLKIVSVISKLKFKRKYNKLRYAAKRLISDIYESEISKVPLRIWFWITVEGQKLSI